jgi:hypothetical protein
VVDVSVVALSGSAISARVARESVVSDSNADLCGRCGAEIDSTRRVDFTLKDGTRVCDSCFVKGTKSPTREAAKRD